MPQAILCSFQEGHWVFCLGKYVKHEHGGSQTIRSCGLLRSPVCNRHARQRPIERYVVLAFFTEK